MQKGEGTGMRLSGNLTENLITLAICAGILAVAGIVHQIQQHKELKEKEEKKKKEIESLKQKAA